MNKNIRIQQTGFDNRYNTWHTLNRNMILYCHSGSGSIVDRQESYPIVPGCLCFVGANRFYYTLPDVPAEYVRSKVFLSNRELEALLQLFPAALGMGERFNPDTMVYAQTDSVQAEKIESVFRELQAYQDKTCYHDALLVGSYIKLLVYLHENDNGAAYPASGMIQKAIAYINSHIQENICIDEICDTIHVSKYYFCKKFKHSTGLTVMDYILKTRIITAKNMLENTELSIGEVSARCGFSSQSYFCRVFKEDAGMTPLQYQRKLPMQRL